MMIRLLVHLLLTAAFLAGISLAFPSSSSISSYCDDPRFEPVWSDEFSTDGVDISKWNIANNTSVGECREAFCSPNNVYVKNGHLHLVSKREKMANGRNFSTGAVNTRGKADWLPNTTFRVCVSAILPGVIGKGQGIWPAHWMMPNENACDPDLGEMDILEMIDTNGFAHSTYHWETTYPKQPCAYPKGHQQLSNIAYLGTNWNVTFHEFSLERGENHLYYAVDQKVIVNTTEVWWEKVLFWNVPFYMILNTAIGGGWPGNPNAETVFPIEHIIDYVRVVQLRK